MIPGRITSVKHTIEAFYVDGSAEAQTISLDGTSPPPLPQLYKVPRPVPKFYSQEPRKPFYDLTVTRDTKKIIEDCKLNEPFKNGVVCAFPLTIHQYACMEMYKGHPLFLYDYSLGCHWEVELLEMFDPLEWRTLMKFKAMKDIYVNEKALDRGCKIRFLRYIV